MERLSPWLRYYPPEHLSPNLNPKIESSKARHGRMPTNPKANMHIPGNMLVPQNCRSSDLLHPALQLHQKEEIK